MRVFLVLLLLLSVLPFIVSADTYYVDASDGDDSNSGTSPDQAWQSISKVNSEMWNFQPGDNILFQRGETFGGTVHLYITCSGSETGGYITFGAYGTGPKPIFDGTNTNVNEGVIASYASINYVTVENIHVYNAINGNAHGLVFSGGGGDHSKDNRQS